MAENNAVTHPAHYTMGQIEVWDAIISWKLDFPRGNAVKYIARAPFKTDFMEDLLKAKAYLQRSLKEVDKEIAIGRPGDPLGEQEYESFLADEQKATSFIAGMVHEAANRELAKPEIALYYLAHPYTLPSPEENVAHCIKVANHLIEQGYNIYAPIIMTHPLHIETERPYDFWMKFDEIMMNRCDRIIMAGDWEHSNGCAIEMEHFKKAGKPILFYEMPSETAP